MPIQVKDYVWEETNESVLITVPLKGVPPNRVDIFSIDEYIKVSYPPYIFEVCLFDEVEDTKSRATFGNGVLKFQLVKKSSLQWNQLLASESEDKEFMKTKREKAVAKAHKRAEEEKERKAAEKREQEKLALREQMKLEQEERARIDAIKDEERKKATEAIERWKENQKVQSSREPEILKEEITEQWKDNMSGTKVDSSSEETQEAQKTSEKPAVKKLQSHNKQQQSLGKKTDLLEKPVPEPRLSGSISVSFTPRVFKTAARESKAPEEEEWLRKMASAGRKTDNANTDAVDMEEMNPVWLKDKGIGFFKAGNYVAAINAFTAAIVLDDSIPSLYSNRAACHLQLKQYKECIQDCTSSLELLVPPVQANCSSRCKAYVRRGTAYMQIHEYVLALQDYESALKLDPHNTDLQRDSERIRKIIQGST
ncbi:dyslexia susceptibility 1 candidate gene 1 protein-like [Orbicella faveolata]|uniref:dyslexia susceptibility 1 candidate gene 1 protein-like n=1 Tax=Orbicella faveolata TaxID=48498 RepID=UPI0009E24F3A|nr:dyslexia susceptibility 1 candidate gene 1 protein-like [Orbicella faveolata]